jgi:N-acetylglucosamine kinase-like BadF-type ATPase
MRILGVDGGQSGIRLRHSGSDRVVEIGGVSRGEGDVVIAVADAVVRGWREGGFDAVDRVVLGLTTAPSDPREADRLAAIVASGTGAREVWVADDAVTAHAGALSMGTGVSLVAGTGVACLALPRHGEPRIIGGHGYLIGDEGGGFWIGSRGLNAVLRAADGRGEATALTAAAVDRFGPLADLHVRLHDADRPVDAIARFAPDVLDAGAAVDPVAAEIAGRAAQELVLLIAAGIAHVHGPHGDTTEDVPTALGGRLLAPGTPLRLRLDGALHHARLPAIARTADGSALDGALLIGLAGEDPPYAPLVHRWPGGPA